MTREQLLKRFPNASESFLRDNCDSPESLRAQEPKHPQGKPLVSPVPGETKSSDGAKGRTRIRFTIFATRPCDWDNWHIKELQDLLVHASILDGDEWDHLQGEVVSEKAKSKAEERTVIEIFK